MARNVVTALLAAFLFNAAAATTLSLGGVTVGASVLDVVKKFGTPNLVQTTDDGHIWQWRDAGGLDREVLTDDDLVVKSVLVARPDAVSTAQPSEAPLLGKTLDDAGTTLAQAGSTPAYTGAATWRSWHWLGGVVVAETASGLVARICALDNATALAGGYLTKQYVPSSYHAPVLIRESVPPTLPPGAGTVIVRVEIDAAGKVTRARVIVTSRDPAVDQFEVDSITHSTFQPATCGGTPCAGVYLDIGGLMR